MGDVETEELATELRRRGVTVVDGNSLAFTKLLARVLRSVGAIVVEKVDGEWQCSSSQWWLLNNVAVYGYTQGSVGILDALAEASETDE